MPPLLQEALVILERILTETARRPLGGYGSQVAFDAQFALAGSASALLLRPAEVAGFVAGWPFVSGTPGPEVNAVSCINIYRFQ